MKNILLGLLFFVFLLAPIGAQPSDLSDKLIILCYHHISKNEPNDNYFTVSQKKFMQQLEYLRAHGYSFVSVQEVIDAKNGLEKLPRRSVLLTFDDAYRSFYEFVYPVLERLGYPSMLAVVGDWIDNGPPPEMPDSLMTWEEIAEVSRSNLVEVASHSYDLHETVQYTSAGNIAAKATSREYLLKEKRYETEFEYKQRILQDFKQQKQAFNKHNVKPYRTVVWPYGRYNKIIVDIAKSEGIQMTFNLDTYFRGRGIKDPLGANRVIVDNWNIDFFAYRVQGKDSEPIEPIRAAQIDLDLIYDPNSAETTEENLGKLIERLVAMEVNTVILQAFHDSDGSGNIKSVYFQNRLLPVAADIFGHAVHQISIRNMKVIAWMPTLSIIFPDQEFNDTYQVREYKEGSIRPTSSWYKRLTPFSPDVRNRISMLYEDLAAHAQIDGILLQDDAYLNDYEDMHPLAIKQFNDKIMYIDSQESLINDKEIQAKWAKFKTNSLNDYLSALIDSAKTYRPDLLTLRNIYARIIIEPESETWFAQNFHDYIDLYDYAVVMAYPQMEKAKRPLDWLGAITQKALTYPNAYSKTIFKLQTYDWDNDSWIDKDYLLKEMRTVLSAGARNLAYYPDNLWENQPVVDTARLEMSTRTSPK